MPPNLILAVWAPTGGDKNRAPEPYLEAAGERSSWPMSQVNIRSLGLRVYGLGCRKRLLLPAVSTRGIHRDNRQENGNNYSILGL